MKKTGFALALVAMLVVPSTALGVTQADKKEAKAQCKAERKAAGSYELFKQIGDPDYKNLGDCITRGIREAARERKLARQQAREECSSQEPALKGKAYAQCVKEATRANNQALDAQDKQKVNAAKACRTEKTEAPDDYAEHGTGKNAFGKCVSAHAKAKRTGTDVHPDEA
jgi:hypothetical protein